MHTYILIYTQDLTPTFIIHTHTHARAHAHTHARTGTHTHTHTHRSTLTLYNSSCRAHMHIIESHIHTQHTQCIHIYNHIAVYSRVGDTGTAVGEPYLRASVYEAHLSGSTPITCNLCVCVCVYIYIFVCVCVC